MTILLAFMCLALIVTATVFFFKSKKLTRLVALRQSEVSAAQQETARVHAETEQSLNEAQKLVDQQLADMQVEADRVRRYYETEAYRIIEDTQVKLTKALSDVESLQRFASLRDAETEVRKNLEVAMSEAELLRAQATALMEQVRLAAESDRVNATERVKVIYEQADARLNQATRDAGRIVAEAEKTAAQTAGESFIAIRDKQMLERAAEAMRNVIEGYGDRYIIPTHSLIDDLAVEFGYTSAGESLKSARTQARRMVEQHEAATCDYVEANRRDTAIRFVIDAFNGRVDAILTRIKHDNYGQLEQEIRDAFNLVNLNGKAFRDARILGAYLNTRLEELKWAVVVQELARKQLEEQRELKARMRDEEKARREYEQQMRQAAKEEELKKKTLEDKERELVAARLAYEQAAAQDKAELERKISEMQQANEGLRRDLVAATERKLTIAQQTKTGTVYIISNMGAFGEGIYKIGQTRRPDPQERIDELGDASVPFDFDVHAWIRSDNAPALEHRLHKRFLAKQVNKVNSRKEFFCVTLKEVREELDRLSNSEQLTIIHWTDVAAAAQYRDSLDIESNPQKMQKWLGRQEALAERALRLDALRLTDVDVTETERQETL